MRPCLAFKQQIVEPLSSKCIIWTRERPYNNILESTSVANEQDAPK
jgi:hypothetical protein